MRTCGLLMPLASLPSMHGVGGLGKEAYRFVDLVSQAGVGIWQILPLNPLGYGNSPYQPLSSFAGDELYIDLDFLYRDGYLTKKPEEISPQVRSRVDYTAARAHKEKYLRLAFERFTPDKMYKRFIQYTWVRPYAVFSALKAQNGLRSWVEWPEDQKNWILDGEYDISPLKTEIAYRMFLQYIFYRQWVALKKYANAKGLQIMGDIPFYVGLDSLDVWGSRENFLINGDGVPSVVAGVPPDFFNEDGQRWGNPIYNWEYLRQTGFKFWIDRLRWASNLYDIVRIDHFRAFDTYWVIPAECPTARVGEWKEAPGYEFFDELFRQLPNIHIVAEDLGDLRPQVLELRDHYGLMGMNVAQFTFMDPNQPIQKNQLVYTGTHDNQTVSGWYHDKRKKERMAISAFLKDYGAPRELICHKLVNFVMRSQADYCIIPVADILGADDKARINTPGTLGSPNWEWRLNNYLGLANQLPALRAMIRKTNRGVDSGNLA